VQEMQGFSHTPVLYDAVLNYLVIGPGIYVDATLGGGGHSLGFLKTLEKNGWLENSTLIGVDQDCEALQAAEVKLKTFGSYTSFYECNFSELGSVLQPNSCKGVLMDLGVSSYQIDTPGRGFSFQKSGALDMRMSLSGSLTAKDVVNSYSQQELANVIFQFGEERKSRVIAKAIVGFRANRPIETTGELQEIVMGSLGKTSPIIKKKTLARVFQSLRIEVNQEMAVLKEGLQAAYDSLGSCGRLGVISYHSLEDRMVKNFFKELAQEDWGPKGLPIREPINPAKVRLITKKPIVPSEQEIANNRRARSAKFRVIEKI